MKKILLLCIVCICCSFNSDPDKVKFRQEVAVMHGTENGLPDGTVDRIIISKDGPMATASGNTYLWNGEQWIKSLTNDKEKKVSALKNLPQSAGKILSRTTYMGNTYVGCENGLFIGTTKNAWEQVLPADDNYSWALKNVTALV
ncbi:MAG TPA: hypothetical protein VLZ54_11650, partial [Arenibacter sp.]|nr:hypothetical protein [Arenibacter sp.]